MTEPGKTFYKLGWWAGPDSGPFGEIRCLTVLSFVDSQFFD
jgi:hypothetical protein